MYHDINYDNDPRISILNVAERCGLKYKPEGKRFTAICPFCGADYGHFYLTPQDGNYKNVFRCVKCNEHGSQYYLYAYLNGFLNDPDYKKRAFKELIGCNIDSNTVKEIKKVYSKNEKMQINKMCSIEKRSAVYDILLKNLVLEKKDNINLIRRGLSQNEILKMGYKTLPFDRAKKINICKLIMDTLRLKNLKAIPGFYTDEYKNWTFWTPKEGGFVIPVRDLCGRIQGLQIRLRNSKNKKRYRWFSSSDMTNGTIMSGCLHVYWNSKRSLKKVVITEGALKGTVAGIMSDTTFVCVPGTNSFNGIVNVLKNMISLKAKRIKSLKLIPSSYKEIDIMQYIKKYMKLYIAYDMDKLSNKHVLKAQERLIKYLTCNGFTPRISKWNPRFKGIDDYLVFIKRNNCKVAI